MWRGSVIIELCADVLLFFDLSSVAVSRASRLREICGVRRDFAEFRGFKLREYYLWLGWAVVTCLEGRVKISKSLLLPAGQLGNGMEAQEDGVRDASILWPWNESYTHLIFWRKTGDFTLSLWIGTLASVFLKVGTVVGNLVKERWLGHLRGEWVIYVLNLLKTSLEERDRLADFT